MNRSPNIRRTHGRKLPLSARRGLSTMEVALATGIMLPFAAGLYFIGKEACGRLFQIIQSLVTWPFL
jgi:hypothetical protein